MKCCNMDRITVYTTSNPIPQSATGTGIQCSPPAAPASPATGAGLQCSSPVYRYTHFYTAANVHFAIKQLYE